MYLPNAEVLTRGGTFAYNKSEEAWDTPESGRFILHNVLAAHRGTLEGLRTADGSRSLAELAEAALEATAAAAPVTAALELITALKAQKEVRASPSCHRLPCIPGGCPVEHFLLKQSWSIWAGAALAPRCPSTFHEAVQ